MDVVGGQYPLWFKNKLLMFENHCFKLMSRSVRHCAAISHKARTSGPARTSATREVPFFFISFWVHLGCASLVWRPCPLV